MLHGGGGGRARCIISMTHAAGIQCQVFHMGRAALLQEHAQTHPALGLDVEAETGEVSPSHIYKTS